MTDLTGAVRIGAAARDLVCPTKATGQRKMATLSTDASPTVTIKLGAITLSQTALASV